MRAARRRRNKLKRVEAASLREGVWTCRMGGVGNLLEKNDAKLAATVAPGHVVLMP